MFNLTDGDVDMEKSKAPKKQPLKKKKKRAEYVLCV